MGGGLTLVHGLKDGNLLDKSLKETLKDVSINSLMMGVAGKFSFVKNMWARIPLEAGVLTAGTAGINKIFGAEGDPTQDMIANVAFMLLMEVFHVSLTK